MADWALVLWLAFGFSLGNVTAYAIGAAMHIFIDRREGAKLVARYYTTTTAMVEDRVTALKTDIVKELDGRSVTIQANMDLGTFMDTDKGHAWSTALADRMVTTMAAEIKQVADSKRGSDARTVEAAIERTLLGNIDWGIPLLNAAWGLAPIDDKRRAVHRVASILRKSPEFERFLAGENPNLSGALDPPDRADPFAWK